MVANSAPVSLWSPRSDYRGDWRHHKTEIEVSKIIGEQSLSIITLSIRLSSRFLFSEECLSSIESCQKL